MKRLQGIFVTVFMFFILSVFINNVFAETPPSYPMLCRGGGNMSFSLSSVHNENSQVIKIRFSKGRQAASQAPISPGTCTWTDRGLRNTEPDTISYTIHNAFAIPNISADGRFNGMSYATSPPNGTNTYRAERDTLQRLINAIMHGGNFQFYAYQYIDPKSTYRTFHATRIGP